MSRPTNQELCDNFRKLLTDGARDMAEAVSAIDYNRVPDPVAAALDESKPWRSDLWKAFAEIERRFCPQPESKADG